MNPEFWQERWREGRIAFHEGRANSLLERHADRLAGRARVLVPLCGKAEDLAFLAARGHHVVGIELVEDAVRAFFAEHGVTPAVTPRGALVEYATDAIAIFAGDFFEVTREHVGAIDAIYDRAAVVALPPDLRPRYAAHLRHLAPGALLFQVALEGPEGPDALKGPPFSVPEAELRTLYAGERFELLDEVPDARNAAVRERCYLIGS